MGSASTVNFAQIAATPSDAPPLPALPKPALHPRLPSVPTTGSRPVPAGDAVAVPAVQPAAPTVVNNFDGINQTTGGGSIPPDPNAATSGSQIVELVNVFIQVTTNSGAVLCNGGVTLNRLLRSSDVLTDPRIQFDNVNNRFSLAVTVDRPASTANPAMYVAASDSADACGTWRVYRLTFNGSSFPAGTFLDFPMLGQDRDALLVSTRNFTPSNGTNFTVFGISKAAVYAGQQVSFDAFNVASLTAPVTNAGQPMISSTFSYFLAAVPGTGYRLYRLTESGGPNAMLELQATISAPFNAPSREANQPGTTSTIDSSDGNILTSPYFDGASIWFAHDFDFGGFPTIRYGAVNVSNSTVTVAMAFHSGTSDDFNPSIGVGLTSGGPAVFLTWAATDALAGIATADVVNSLAPGGPISNLVASSTAYVTGAVTGQNRFGDFSSVSLDPAAESGTCAVVAQQYFATGGSWETRIARVGTCQPPVTPVIVPDLRGDTVDDAASALSSVGLSLGHVGSAIDHLCNNINTVMSQNPGAGAQVSPGTAVNITIGQKPPPPFECP
jgi:hypothetical protein